MIRSQEEQDFLFNLLHNIHKNENGVWIGAQYTDKTLKWSDNVTVNYTNWANGNPRNNSGYDCVQMSMIEPNSGQWMIEPCNISYLVVCQKTQNRWLFSYLQKTVMQMRESIDNITQQLESAQKNSNTVIDNLTRDLQLTKNELQNTKLYLEDEIRKKSLESTPPGTIAYFSNTSAPIGWLKANGQSVSRTTYANLFASIGTTFGSGDGSTTFTLPDLRGEFIRGWSDGRDVDKDRSFGSFQWGSTIFFAGRINGEGNYIMANAWADQWSFAGALYDEGFEGDAPTGVTRNGVKLETRSSAYIYTTSGPANITDWNLFKGTRPRNMACIKY